MNSGIRMPTMPCTVAAPSATSPRKRARVDPAASMLASAAVPERPPFTPMMTGVPRAPKVTGVDWMISPHMTAAMAGKPRARSRGAATAAGVPNPEAPSMNDPNSQAMMIACTRRSGLTRVNAARMLDIAPDAVIVASRSRAPKTM